MTSMGVDLTCWVTPVLDSQLVLPREMANPDELLVENLALLERVIGFTCRRQRLSTEEAEEFAGVVRLRLVENDYAILRKFEGRSSLATFLAVVVQRLLLDYRIHERGKWHASAEAKRQGDLAVELERLLYRDEKNIADAHAVIAIRDPSLTRDVIERIAAQLPTRGPKRTFVSTDDAVDLPAYSAVAFPSERRHLSEKVSSIVRSFLTALPSEERLVLQFRFENGMTVAEIARSLGIDQKRLYRTLDKHLRDLRSRFEESGISQ